MIAALAEPAHSEENRNKTMQINPWLSLLVASLLVSGCKSDDDPSITPKSNTPDSGTPNAETDSGTPNTEAVDSGTPNSETADSGVQCQLNVTAADSAPTIVGTYTDGYETQQIAAATWTIATSVFHLSQVDNVQLFAIAQNDCANPCYGGVCYGGEWSRFDWTFDAAHSLWYCQTAYDAASAEQALQTPAANAQNLDTGCAGFAWSKLTPSS
jgi:hypothetical protein